MGLVTLITGVESFLEEEHQIDVTLVSEDAFSRRRSPFRTIDALADYILELSGAPAADVMEAADKQERWHTLARSTIDVHQEKGYRCSRNSWAGP